jgi:hypothetical protein
LGSCLGGLKLFRRSDWLVNYNGGIYVLVMKLTALLVSLKPDETETFEFHLDYISDMPCFSHDRRTSDSVLKILRAILPTLQYKGRKIEKKGKIADVKETAAFYDVAS